MTMPDQENCQLCAMNGIQREASYDAPVGSSGAWAYICKYCFLRLPKDCQKMATKLQKE